MAEIDFYTNPMSRGQIARWGLHEAGADYEQHLIEYDHMKDADYLAINPMGKVPAIVHDGKVVTEGAAICAYLAEVYPDARLLPTDTERADYLRWFFFAAGPVESAVTNNALGFHPDSEQERMAGYGTYDRTVQTLSDHFADKDYVCGERFTMADVYVGAQVTWGMQFGSITKTDALEAYAERVQQRPAYQAAKAIDDELIAQQQE